MSVKSRPKDDGHRAPDPDAALHKQIVDRLRATAARLRDDVDVVHVDPLLLAELLEHTAAVWTDGVYARHQWPAHRQLVARLVQADEAPVDGAGDPR